MKNYDEYEMAGKTVSDKKAIAKALKNGHELQVDNYDRVLDEDGNWIADCKEEEI